ncbi:helix-turn-helix domain-containing protein [Planosporangium mesophilum]|uniref:Cyclic diguanylate phosphodiesterase n=1 Tax=Planosporangium mesophilum TaxID=689768 RepID=A0A8J3X1H1_9ACTN|nr:GAF domain-containing protein [Planosporangium mesophilum]NJC85107.1 GAF domain-containing protein [Planosporangium mesophilum]GII24440.1 cyclic diguanylate phosphodiesterase [Planosporangium mesophilum]
MDSHHPGPTAGAAAWANAFLDLLAREAPTVEFDRPVLEARTAGAPPAVLDAIERARGVALGVRALLERRRRREAELSALIDTISDLATLHDLDAVLEAIVRRARKLLGTDVTYMTLRDSERGDTYMRVTDGSVSAQFQQLRLPMGAGLGGLVAQTATPYVTATYPGDGRFRHTTEIDAAVAEEGIVAILGVPLRLGSRIVGVLFAANRSARPFSRDEITLLGSLAAHAAVAIDNARLLAETRAALAELSTANRLISEHSASVERAAEAHDRMAGLVLHGGDVSDLAASVAELLAGALSVLDADGRCLASVGTVGPPDALADAAASARALGRTVQRGELWATVGGAGGQALCSLVLRPTGELAEADLRILERAAVVTALLLLSRRSLAEAESRVRGELLDDLVSRPIEDLEMVRERARRFGVDLDEVHAVLVLRGPAELRQRITAWAAGQAAHRGGLAAYRDGVGVLLVPGSQPGELARQLAREVRAAVGVPVTVGAAGPVHAPDEVADAFAEAERCAGALVALGRAGEGASGADLGFVGLLLGSGDRDIEGYVRAALGPVLDYDARHGTVLRQTLEAYFGVGASPARAAEVLHVHVNTVTQRLGRLANLLGADWQRPERALDLQLALRLYRLRDG